MAATLEVLVAVQDRELQSLRKDIRTLSREMGGMSTSTRSTGRSFDNLNRSSGKAGKGITQATRGAIAGSGAFRGLGRAVAFSSAAFLGAAGLSNVLRGAFDELQQSGKVAAQTNAVLTSTGHVAGVTAKHVDELAASLLKKSGIDDEQIKQGENWLLTFKQVRDVQGKNNDIFTHATKAALDLAVAQSIAKGSAVDMAQSANLLGKALNDPVKGVTALTRVGVTFTDKQKATIKSLVEHNHVLAAQRLILAEVDSQVKGSAKTYGNTLPGQLSKAEEAFRNLTAAGLKPIVPQISAAAQQLQKFFEKPQNAKALQDGIREVASGARDVAGAINTAKDAVGGWKNALKLLIALKVGSTVVGWSKNIGLLTTEIGPAGGEKALGRATKLRAALAGLKGLGAISIVVGLEMVLTNKGAIDKFGNAIDATLDKALSNVPGFKNSALHGWLSGSGVFGHKQGSTALDPGGFGTSPGMSSVFPGAVGTKTRQTQGRIARTALTASRKPGASGAGFEIPGGKNAFGYQDCSSFTRAIYRSNGISIGSVTTTQWSGAPIKSKSRKGIQPGDLIFFYNHNGTSPPPDHVGIYLGNGRLVEDHGHDRGVTSGGVDWGTFYGWARYTKAGDTAPGSPTGSGGGTATGGGTGGGAAPPQAGLAPKPKKKKVAAKAAGTSELLPQALRLRLAEAGSKPKQELAALRAESKFLTEAISHTKRTSEKRVQLQELLTSTQERIAALTKRAEPKKKAAAASGELVPIGLRLGLSRAEGRPGLQDDLKALRNIQTFLRGALKGTKGEKRLTILDELNNVKGRIGGIVRDIIDNAKTAVEKQRGKLGDSFGKVADSMLAAFDEKTLQLGDSLSATFDALTPAEQELLGIQTRQRGRDRTDLVAALDKAQKRAGRATGRRSTQAQRDLQDAQDALKTFDLEPVAQAERDAREKQRTAALAALEKQRADERQALEDKIAEFQTMLETGGLSLGSSFAKGLVSAFPEFKKAVDAYFDYLRTHGLLGTAGSGTRAAVTPGMDPSIATAIRSAGSRSLASAPAPIVQLQPVIFAADLAEATAKYNRRNGRQL